MCGLSKSLKRLEFTTIGDNFVKISFHSKQFRKKKDIYFVFCAMFQMKDILTFLVVIIIIICVKTSGNS
jgi:hypothetical protein